MVLTPAVRGLLGIETDAQNKTLRLDPHLPASWDRVSIQQVPLGDLRLTVEMARSKEHLVIAATVSSPAVFCLARQSAEPTDCEHAPRTREQLSIPLPGAEIELPNRLPTPGSETSQIKVLDETSAANSLSLILEAPGGSMHNLRLRRNRQIVAIDGASATADTLTVSFPPGAGYTRQTVRLVWKRPGRLFAP
jgi:hypothetical protein